MNRKQSILIATLGTVTLAAAFTVTGAGAAGATEPNPSGTDPSTQSCWLDVTTQQSLCVPTGTDLITAVQGVSPRNSERKTFRMLASIGELTALTELREIQSFL